MTGAAAELAVGVGRFVRGGGVLEGLDAEVRSVGGRPYVLGGLVGLDLVAEHIPEASVAVIRHDAGCTRDAARRYADDALMCGATVIVGVGGGVILDLAKAVATLAGLPVITVPTSVATCVAASSVCIMYDADGRPDGSLSTTRAVHAVFADLEIIAAAPPRLLAAGVLDTMAKLPELRHPRAGEAPSAAIELALRSAIALSATLYDDHLENARAVVGDPTPASVEATVVSNLLLTAVVSGLCSGSGQLALAHGFYDWLRREYPERQPRFLHGEVVGVGILIQQRFNGEDPAPLRDLMIELGVPTSIVGLGVDPVLPALADWLAEATGVADADRGRLVEAIEASRLEP